MVIDLEKHGRTISKDPIATRELSLKLRPYRHKKDIFFTKDPSTKVSIIALSTKKKLIRTGTNTLKIYDAL